MRRVIAVVLTLVLSVVLAAPASAEKGDVIKFKQTYAIPEDLAEVEDLGELNIPCSAGQYTLVEGTFKKETTMTFLPSQEAWDARDPGATMAVVGLNTYRGLWDVDTDPDARFELRDNNLRYRFTFGTENPDEPESVNFSWKGRFIDSDTGDVAEWWNFDVTFDASGETVTVEGTCEL